MCAHTYTYIYVHTIFCHYFIFHVEQNYIRRDEEKIWSNSETWANASDLSED